MADTRVTPNRWLWTPRNRPIRFIEIHATRGPASNTPQQDYTGTINWMQNPNNRAKDANGKWLDWGGACSYILGPEGDMATVLDDGQQPTYNAGYGAGGSGAWSIDEYGIGYEWAQPAGQPAFSDAMYARGAKEIAKKCRTYGIPPVMLSVPNQTGPVPTGIVRHDRCENGAKLGKSDPGPRFDEAKFIALLNAELQEDNDVPTPQEWDDFKAENAKNHGDLNGYINNVQSDLNNYKTAEAQANAAMFNDLLKVMAEMSKGGDVDATIAEIQERLKD